MKGSFPESACKNNLCTIRSYLEEYYSVFKQTQQELLKLETRKNADLEQITQYFDRIRRELDSKEQLLKFQYSNILSSYATSLSLDYDYLSSKCQSLCDTIEIFSKKLLSQPEEEIK